MSTSKTFYVLHGSDEFSLKNEVKSIRSKMGDPSIADLNTSLHDGKSATVIDVIAAAKNFPFLSDKRLVIVEGMLTWLTRKGAGKTGKADLELLATELPHLPPSTRLLFVDYEALDDAHPILRLAQASANGYTRLFRPPDNPTEWIISRVTALGGKIETPAAVALGHVVGSDLRALDSECFKLLTYLGNERPIREADVALLTSYVPDTSVFEIVDAIAKRDGMQALKLIHRLLDNSKQDAFSLFGVINRQFRLLIMVRELLDVNGNPRQLPEIARLPTRSKDFLIQQARTFGMRDLERIYRNLLEVDHDFKQGKISDDLALDLLVAGLDQQQ